ncbi:hypothetical protein K1719_041870 [Acacia pycnantha]|nr:hypothetical protein K1719_041870 [Acacia pycnantha]
MKTPKDLAFLEDTHDVGGGGKVSGCCPKVTVAMPGLRQQGRRPAKQQGRLLLGPPPGIGQPWRWNNGGKPVEEGVRRREKASWWIGGGGVLKAGFLNSLEDNEKIKLVRFHLFHNYVSSSNFDSLTNPVPTLAGDNPARFQLNVTAYGNSVNILTGVVNATITGAVYSYKQLAIYHVDKALLALDFFQPKPPAPAPALAKAPKSDKDESWDENEVQTTKHNSGAVSLIGVQGTMLASLVIVAAISI